MIEDKIKLKLYSYNQIIDYFKKKNLKNIVLFSQARSGSTFVTENLPKLMGFSQNQIFHEGYFLKKHWATYLIDLSKIYDLNVVCFTSKKRDKQLEVLSNTRLLT